MSERGELRLLDTLNWLGLKNIVVKILVYVLKTIELIIWNFNELFRTYAKHLKEFHNILKILWQLGRRRLTDDGVSPALRLLGEVHSSKKLLPGVFY